MKKKFIKIPMKMVEEIVDSMVEVELPEDFTSENFNGDESKKSSSFVMVMEVLTRIGFLKENTLYQTAHILKKKGKYYLCHFKQLFMLDGLNSSYDERDKQRLYKIAQLLDNWGMVNVVDRSLIENSELDNVFVNIVPVEKIRSGEIQRVKKYGL